MYQALNFSTKTKNKVIVVLQKCRIYEMLINFAKRYSEIPLLYYLYDKNIIVKWITVIKSRKIL